MTATGSGMVSVDCSSTIVGFSPLHIDKDVVVLCMLVGLFGVLLLQVLCLAQGLNACSADVLLTPAWVVPEWYFLAVYCVLKVVP